MKRIIIKVENQKQENKAAEFGFYRMGNARQTFTKVFHYETPSEWFMQALVSSGLKLIA